MKALTEAYYFISGLNYLITQGELSGAGILIEGDNNEELDTNISEKQETTENKEVSNNTAENVNAENNTAEANVNAENNAENGENQNAENSDDNATDTNEIVLGNDGFNESLEDEDLFVEPESESESELEDEENLKQ